MMQRPTPTPPPQPTRLSPSYTESAPSREPWLLSPENYQVSQVWGQIFPFIHSPAHSIIQADHSGHPSVPCQALGPQDQADQAGPQGVHSLMGAANMPIERDSHCD